MRNLGVFFLIIFILAFNACEKKVDTQADEEAIKKLIEKSDIAWNSGDGNALSDLYCDDAVQMPANEPSRMGKETIIARAKAGFEKVHNTISTSIEDINVTEDWGYGLVSAVYEKIGLKDILSDDTDVKDYLGRHTLLTSYFERIKEETDGHGKTRDMETLAFHLLTMPEMREL